MANMLKYNVMKKKVAVLEDAVEKLEQERAAAMSQAMDEEQQHKVQETLDWFAAKMIWQKDLVVVYLSQTPCQEYWL